MFSLFIDTIKDLAAQSGLAVLGWQNVVMILISFVFMYLAIRHKFEPLLLLPIAFGMLLTNLPNTGLYHPELWNIDAGHELNFGDILHNGGLLDMLYLGVKLQIYPALIFLGIGCMTDFAPLIANPKSFLLGAAAQAGIFLTFGRFNGAIFMRRHFLRCMRSTRNVADYRCFTRRISSRLQASLQSFMILRRPPIT